MRWFSGVILIGLLSLLIAAQAQVNAFAIITPENVGRLEIIHTLQLTNTYANQIVFNPSDSSQLAAAQNNGDASLWDMTTGEKIIEWTLVGPVTSLAYTTDGTQLITADESGDVIVWDMVEFTRRGTKPDPVINLKRENEIPQFVDTADNDLLAVVYEDGPTRLWNSRTGLLYTTIHGYKGVPYAVDLRSDGRLIAIGYRWGFSKIFTYDIDLSTPQQVFLNTIYYNNELIDLALAEEPDPSIFLDRVGLVTVNNFYPLQKGDTITYGDPNMHHGSMNMAYPSHVAINRTGQLVAVGGKETSGGGGCTRDELLLCHVEITHFFLKDVEEGIVSQPVDEIVADLKGHDAWLTDVIFSPDDRFLATASMDTTIMIWGYPQP